MLEGVMSDIYELANVIFHEARGEPLIGQIAVGWVVLNRVKDSRFPSTIRGVVWQRGQFQNIRKYSVPERFLRLAREILDGKHPNPVGNALFFARNGRGKRIGAHGFR